METRDLRGVGAIWALCALGGVLLPGCASSGRAARVPDGRRELPTTQFLFPSGLQVVMERDATASLAGVVVVVDAGSGDDPPGMDGLAHLVEHLVFDSFEPARPALHGRLDQLGAAAVNASTQVDLTEYHAFVPAAAARAAIVAVLQALDARLAGVSEREFDRERRVVMEEIGRNQAAFAGNGAVSAQLFPETHPYHHAVGGTAQTLGHIRLEDARAFLARHYRPERITVFVSGDVGRGPAEALLTAVPPAMRGDAAHRRAPQRQSVDAAQPLEPLRPRQTPVIEAEVATRELWIGWPLPSAGWLRTSHARFLDAFLTAAVPFKLEAGEGFGIRNLQFETLTYSRGGWLLARGQLLPGTDADVAASRVARAVQASWKIERSSPQLADRVRILTMLKLAEEEDSVVSRSVARARFVHRDPDWKGPDLLGLEEVLAGLQVTESVAGYLEDTRMRFALLVPQRPGDGGPRRLIEAAAPGPAVVGAGGALAGAGGAPPPQDRAEEPRDPDDTDPTWAASRSREQLLAAIAPSGADAAQTVRLPNGLQVIVLPRAQRALATALLAYRTPWVAAESAAVAEAARWALTAEGGDVALRLGMLGSHPPLAGVTARMLRFLPSRAHEAVALLDHERDGSVLRWPSSALERAAEQLRPREARPEARAARQFFATVWDGHPCGLVPTVDLVRAVPWPELNAWIQQARRPEQGLLVVLGDLDPTTLLRDASESLGSWRAKGPRAERLPPPPPLREVGELRVIETDAPGDAQARMTVGCRLPPVTTPRQAAVYDIMSELLRRALHDRLRLELGIAYAVVGKLDFQPDAGAVLSLETEVAAADGPTATANIRAAVSARGALSSAAGELDIDRQRWRAIRARNLGHASPASLATELVTAWKLGWPPRAIDDRTRALVDVTADEVRGAFATCAANAVLSVAAPAQSADRRGHN